MKDVSIIESGKEFKFSGTGKLETELQEGGFCYWVPKEEREIGQIFASENREYTPEEINMYGIGEVNVNIIFTGIDPDGNPWSVIIDPDTGLPVIKYPDIEMLIDPETGNVIIKPIDGIEPIAEIDGDLLGDMGFDPEGDIDMSLDDLGDLDDPGVLGIVGDIDGIPSVVDLDLDDLEWDTEDCPASIKVMHVPDKTSYNDGEAINYDGLVVRAFKEDGSVWTSDEYPSGYIPVHKLNLPKYSDITEADANVEVPGYAPINNTDSVVSIRSIIDIFQDHFPDNISEAQKETMRYSMSGYVPDAAISYAWCYDLPPIEVSAYMPRWTGCVVITGQPGGDGLCDAVRYSWHLSYYQSSLEGFSTIFNLTGPLIENIRINLFQGYEEETGLLSNANASILNYSQPMDAEWVSPCLNTLSSSFKITVNPKQDHGGSHHSGKF